MATGCPQPHRVPGSLLGVQSKQSVGAPVVQRLQSPVTLVIRQETGCSIYLVASISHPHGAVPRANGRPSLRCPHSCLTLGPW